MQAVATATTLLEVAGNPVGLILNLAWAPLLMTVAFLRAPTPWRKTIALSTAVVVASAAVYVLVRLAAQPGDDVNVPHWQNAHSVGLRALIGTWWFAQQFVVVPLLAILVRLTREATSGAEARRVGRAVGVVATVASAVAMGTQVALVRVMRLDPNEYLPVPDLGTLNAVVAALALPVVAVLLGENEDCDPA